VVSLGDLARGFSGQVGWLKWRTSGASAGDGGCTVSSRNKLQY